MELTLFLDHACNLRCDYCYGGHKFTRRMPSAVMKRAVDLALAERPPLFEVSFFGGEPLLHPDLIEETLAYVESASALTKAGLFLCLSGCTSYSSPTTNASAGQSGSQGGIAESIPSANGGYASLAGAIPASYQPYSSGPGGSGGNRGDSGGFSDGGGSSVRSAGSSGFVPSSSGGYSTSAGTTASPYQGGSSGYSGTSGGFGGGRSDSPSVQDAGADSEVATADTEAAQGDASSAEVSRPKPDGR